MDRARRTDRMCEQQVFLRVIMELEGESYQSEREK